MRWIFLYGAVLACYLFSVDLVYGAPFGDMFSGKKKYEKQLNQKDQECQAMIRQMDLDYQNLADKQKNTADTMNDLRNKNSTLVEAYEKIISDQGTIMEQLNRLRRENQRCEEIRGSYDQMTEESEAFLQENKSLEQDARILKITLDNLKLHIGELNAEKEQLSILLDEAREGENTKIKKIREKVKNEIVTLKRNNKSLQGENNTLSKLLKEFEKKARILELKNLKVGQLSKDLQAQLTALDKDYADLKDENRHLAHEAAAIPKRFTDLARHNRKLVKETSYMHYNMGVSFIKAKEYKRAIKEFKKVLELDPDDAYANYNLGYIYSEHLVDRVAAIRYFKTYLVNAKNEKDINWVKKYILTWQTWYGKEKVK